MPQCAQLTDGDNSLSPNIPTPDKQKYTQQNSIIQMIVTRAKFHTKNLNKIFQLFWMLLAVFSVYCFLLSFSIVAACRLMSLVEWITPHTHNKTSTEKKRIRLLFEDKRKTNFRNWFINYFQIICLAAACICVCVCFCSSLMWQLLCVMLTKQQNFGNYLLQSWCRRGCFVGFVLNNHAVYCISPKNFFKKFEPSQTKPYHCWASV